MRNEHDGPWLILVAGHPATGKTTLARHLSAQLRFPMIAKDVIKERLFDVLGTGDEAWSHLLGRASMAVLYDQIASILAIGHSVVAEANFDGELAARDLVKILEEHPAAVVRVVLQADPEALIQRCQERADSGERHPGHLDQTAVERLSELVRNPYIPPELPGPMFEIDVTDLDTVDLDRVTQLVRQALDR